MFNFIFNILSPKIKGIKQIKINDRIIEINGIRLLNIHDLNPDRRNLKCYSKKFEDIINNIDKKKFDDFGYLEIIAFKLNKHFSELDDLVIVKNLGYF